MKLFLTTCFSILSLFYFSSCSQQIRAEIAEGAKRGWKRGVEASRNNPVPASAFQTHQPAFVPINTGFINKQPVLPSYPSYNSNTSQPRSYDIYDSSGTQHLGTLEPVNNSVTPISGLR